MKSNLFIISTLLCCALLGGCGSKVHYEMSKDVQQGRIFQLYKAEYHADDDQLVATAAFHIDNASGTLVKLSDKSSIDCNGNEMKWSRNGNYTFTAKGLADTIPFAYQNNDKESFNNKLIVNSIKINQENITLLKNSENLLVFEGKDFEEHESVLLVLLNNGDDIEVETDVERRNIIISEEYLSSVAKGTYQGYFIRKNYSSDVNASDRGGVWESSYFSNEKTITIQ